MATKQRIEVEAIFQGNIANITQSAKQIQTVLDKLRLPNNLDKGFSSTLAKLDTELKKFGSLSKSGIGSSSDFKALEKSGQNIINLYNRLQLEMRELNNLSDKDLRNLFPSNVSENIKRATAAIKEYTQNVKPTTKEEEKLTKQLQTKKKKLEELNAAQKKANSLSKEDVIKSKERSLKSYQNLETKAQARVDANPNDSKAVADLERYKAKVQEVTQAITQLKSKSAEEIRSESLNKLKSEADVAQKEVLELENSLTSIKSTNATAFNNLVAKLKEITGVDFSNLTYSEENLAKMQTRINGLDASRIQQIRDSFKPLGQEIKNAGEATKPLAAGMREAEKGTEALVRKKQELDTFKNTLTYFFSLNNMFFLLRRAINAAFRSIADLDKAMTATAVVTDFTVGDMWEQLPRYTKIANELGVTTLGAYETMTLFYQQGLNTNEAFELGAETMKMARIAGLDYAEATDKMTAALRGFNMELNTLSAQRVSDVYSQLAAITAADTEEISTAMTKTASIANSANMEFETTAAFLSQIIETTRESAETAGTALKTVIARFQELKKDPAEIGEVDGEVVDANKIETALRSVGVALRDTNGQFRDLDDVFLELSEKWDTLDVNTQRYVATIAAGSRQQSRFIAMMSDYGRTVELVNAAYGSAGASQKQYEKTLESWESKIAQLKNAWQEFVLGIIDSDLAKFIVDTGTTTLNILNKLTKGVGGLSTTFLRLGVVIGGLKLGKVLLPALGSSLLDKSKPFGVGLGKSIKEGLKVEFGKKKGFKIPIGISPSLPTKNQKEIGRLTDSISNAYYARRDPSGLENRRHKLIQEQQALKTQYLNASAAAQLRYNAAIAQGIPLEEAEALLTKESTIEDYKAMAAKHEVAEAEIEGTVVTQGSILARVQQTLATKIQTAAQQKQNAATLSGKIANWAYTKSALAAKLAMLGMAAAAVAVVAGIVLLVKHIKNNTPEKKLERAAEATKKAQEAADAAKNAYNDLNNTLKSLGDHEKELDTLIEGTDAWREKVIEINSEFSKLIDLYPDLQKFIKFDAEKGVYQWTDGGQAAQKYLESANIEMAERQYEVSNNREIEGDAQITKEVTDYNQFGANHNTPVFLSDEEAKQIAIKLSKFGGRASEDDLRNILENALPTATQESINALAKNSKALYALTDSINNQVVDTRPQAEAYIHTLLNTNDAYADIEDPNLKKYILATTTNKTKEEDFTEGKYKQDSEVINAYASRNRTDLNATYGAGQYNIAVKDDQIIVQALNGEVLRTIGTVEQVRKQLSIEDYATGEVDVGAQTEQFNNEVAQVLTKIYSKDVEKATPEQLNNVLQIVLTAAEKNIGFSADGDNENYYATGFSGLSYQDLEALKTDSDFVELVEKAIIAKQNSVRQTNKNFNFDIETDADWRKAGQDLDMSTEALELYTKEIEKNSAALQGNKNAAKLVAAEGLALKKAFSELEPIFEDSASALDNFGSPEYFKAIDKIAKALKNIAGLENITPEDITPDRLQLLTDAMNGSTDAFIRFRKEIALAKALKLDLPKKEIDYITNALNDLNGFNTEISASFDTSKLEAGMLELYNAGKITVTTLNDLFSGVGYRFVVDYVDETPVGNIDGDVDRWLMDKYSATLSLPRLKMVPIGETGTSNFSSSTDNSGGSGDSGNDYKADYDKHYNKMEDLAEEQRVRNDLEKEYNKLLRDNNTTISDITKNINAQIDSLKREREIQEFLYDARRQQIHDTMSEYSDLQGYASYNFADNTIEIDYDAIKAITDEELGSRIDEYISKLEELQDQMDEANDALAEIEEQIIEALEKGKEEYFNLEERAMEALVHSYEQEIDELNRINDSINDANSELLNSINSTLERQRREEENAEKEQELSDMQRRLDYLRQDTSGANALEIKQLEKELAEAQDDYTDSLIDQKISELEEQNDKAAEQREKQIAFAEAQLEAAQKTGALWDEIHKMFDTDIDENGIKTDSKLLQLLMAAEDFPSQSELERNKWLADLYAEVRNGFSWLQDKNDVSDLLATGELSEGQEITFIADNQEYHGIVNADGTVTANDAIFHNVKRDQRGNYSTTETYDEAKRKAQTNKTPEPSPSTNDTPVLTEDIKRGVSAAIWNGNYGWGLDDDRSARLREVFGENDIQENYVNENVQSGYSGSLSDYSYTAMRLKFKKYKTGGLADFTGPAWLDGTKSRPELILNQRDTQNFIQLRNVLAEATKSGFGKSEKNEAVMFDIDINIDKVENEENVDALLTELERRINSYASYRNVTALTLKR